MKKTFKKKIYLKIFVVAFIMVLGMNTISPIFAPRLSPKASAAERTIPPIWKDGSDEKQKSALVCKWESTARLLCADANGVGNRWVDYILDVKKSAEAGFLVFIGKEGAGGNLSDIGYLAFSRGRSNDAFISTDYLDPSGGAVVDNVNQDARFKSRNTSDEHIEDQNKNICSTTEETLKEGCRDSWPPAPTTATKDEIEAVKKMVNDLSTGSFGGCEEAPGLVIQYVVCPIINLMQNGIAALIGGTAPDGGQARRGLLITFLQIKPINLDDPTSAFNQLLRGMINVANALFIVIFLIIIFSSSLPYGLDNYSIKKMLPKFILAVILTQFAPLITVLIIDFFNILGQVVPNIIFALAKAPGATETLDLNRTGDVVTGTINSLLGVGAVVFLIILILVMLLLAVIAAFIGFIYMVIRLLLIYAMVLLSPLAFLCMVLPGTKKFFDEWWKGFIRLNAMFVTITGMVAISIVLANALKTSVPEINSGTEPDSTSVIIYLAAALIPIAAFFLIPKTLKWTTQAMGAAGKIMGGAMNKGDAAGKWAYGKGKGAAKNQTEDFRNRMAAKETRFGRTMAAGAGGFFNTKGSKRAIAARANKYQQERNAEVQTEYAKNRAALTTESAGKTDAEKAKLQLEYARKAVQATGKDAFSRQALMRSAAQTGDTATLRALQSEMTEAEWNQGVSADYAAFDGVAQYRQYDSSYKDLKSIDTSTPTEIARGVGRGTAGAVAGLKAGDLMKLSGQAQKDIVNNPEAAAQLDLQSFVDAHADTTGRAKISSSLRQAAVAKARGDRTSSDANVRQKAEAVLARIDDSGNWI